MLHRNYYSTICIWHAANNGVHNKDNKINCINGLYKIKKFISSHKNIFCVQITRICWISTQ